MKKLPSIFALLLIPLAAHPGLAQPAEAPPEPHVELVLESFQWLEPDLLAVHFEVRNTGEEPAIVSQQPGVLLGVSCRTETGYHGTIPGGITCGPDKPGHHYSLWLEPGQALQGEKVVKVPEVCVGDITVEGLFETVIARDWDFPALKTSLQARPLRIDDAR